MKKIAFLLVIPISLIVALSACTRDDKGLHNVIYNAVTDVDGNSYDAVRIGEQVWMKSNLRTSHLRDGSEITTTYYSGNWEEEDTVPRYQSSYHIESPLGNSFENESYEACGFAYNRAAVADNRGLCPEGWHVPDDEDWTQLKQYVSSRSEWCYNGEPGSIGKALASKNYWVTAYRPYLNSEGSPWCHPEENNATGFSAVPNRYYYNDLCQWWSSTEEYYTYSPRVENHQWELYYDDWICSLVLYSNDYHYGHEMHNVRCLRD